MAFDLAKPPRCSEACGIRMKGKEPAETLSKSDQPREWMWALLCIVFTIPLTVSLFPTFDVAEAAYLFLLPFLFWSLRRPKWNLWIASGWFAHWVAWILILIWLRHVTWVGLILLSAVLALFPTAWLILVRRYYPQLDQFTLTRRISLLIALSGAWVLTEWVRSWFLTGFPWLPLAASQWTRPVLLQLAPWTGAWGISFLLVFFNLAIARYVQLIVKSACRTDAQNTSQPTVVRIRFHFCPEFYLALSLFFGVFLLFLLSLPEQRERTPLFRAGVVQPWIPATLKWDREEALNNLQILKWQSEAVSLLDPDLILWPEAATPVPIRDDTNEFMLQWVENLIAPLGKPLLMGNLIREKGKVFNGIFLFEPTNGLHEKFYAKIRLVPFGEYVPLRRWIPFVNKVIPFSEDIVPGSGAVVLPLETNGQSTAAGGLVCYEDVFPQLGIEVARAGADFVFVVTNDAWYGEEAGAYQHAAHSVLRAAEIRRPIIRCGNHGWSGWIDEYGNVRQILRNAEGSIYFRGGDVLDVTYQPEWRNRSTFFVRYGNWFIALCALSQLTFFLGRKTAQ